MKNKDTQKILQHLSKNRLENKALKKILESIKEKQKVINDQKTSTKK